MTDAAALSALLAIEDRVFEATLVDLITREALFFAGEESTQLTLTERGKRLLADAHEIRPLSVPLSVNYDALVGDVVPPFGDYLHPRQLKEYGIRELPLPSRLRPELHRLDIRAVEAVVRQMSAGREPLRNILALKSMRRFRVFRPAVALVYRGDASEDVQVSIAIDGELSERHTLAFAEAGLTRKLGLESEGVERSELSVAPFVDHQVAAILRDDERNRRMREIKRAIRASERTDGKSDARRDDEEAVKERGERARESFDDALIKSVDTFEHPDYLNDALANSQQRLIIVSPWLRREVMDNHFMKQLESLLDQGVHVHIGWGISKDEAKEPNADRRVLQKLEELGERHGALEVQRLGGTHAKVLVSDERYVIVTSFNWLSFRGDPKRTFRDERGTLVSHPDYVRARAQEWLSRFREAANR